MQSNYRDIFFRFHAENQAERVVSDLSLFFKKALHEVNESDQNFGLNIFW